jgi:hypothetical protein
MTIDKKDFKLALQNWYWILDEYNDLDNKEFNNILDKYNLTVKELFNI